MNQGLCGTTACAGKHVSRVVEVVEVVEGGGVVGEVGVEEGRPQTDLCVGMLSQHGGGGPRGGCCQVQ